jgi:glyoxylase-like metal-dependent hydrolase (beta-lactamase superfamily II)
MELEPGIHQLTIGREPFKGFPPPNAFLVAGSEASILIDTGYDDPADHEARLAFLADAGGPPLTEIILTHRHPDHGGGAASLHQATGAPLSCHPLDREALEQNHLKGRAPIANELVGGESRELGGLTLEIIHGPGHTWGCLAIYIPERGALFTTDTVMGISTTVIRPGDGSLREYEQTLHLFQGIGAKVIYPGHGGPIDDPVKRLNQLIEHRLRREEELLAALATGPQTPKQLRETIYQGLPEVRQPLAEAQVTTGLNKLIEDGLAQADDGRYALV